MGRGREEGLSALGPAEGRCERARGEGLSEWEQGEVRILSGQEEGLLLGVGAAGLRLERRCQGFDVGGGGGEGQAF